MGKIIKSKTCPKCGEPDALVVCATVGAVNCPCCFEFIRALTKKERQILEENIKEILKEINKSGKK